MAEHDGARARMQALEAEIRRGASRREVLKHALALSALGTVPVAFGQSRARLSADPFTLGVASGYPHPGGFTLWTRLAPSPLEPDGGMTPEWVFIEWEVAADEGFGQVLAKGRFKSTPDLGHSIHIDVDGLAPDRVYHYRFRVGDWQSPIGRCRTAPDVGTAARTRFAVCSCQHYEQGWFNAYQHLKADRPDFVAFVGDYIYESSWGDDLVRRHVNLDPRTLGEYRATHAQYRQDPYLQDIQQEVPFVYTWDDHEVQNDYAGLVAETWDPQFWLRRAAAYQAFYEHTPLPARMRPGIGGMRIYDSHSRGREHRFHILDARQYRDMLACPPPQGGGHTVAPADCPDFYAERSLLGEAQERWLDEQLKTSAARFNFIVQPTLFLPTDQLAGTGEAYGTDSWSGYPRARERLIQSLTTHQPQNPIIVGGDVHSFYVTDIRREVGKADSPVIASEYCGTSITGQGRAQELVDRIVAETADIHYGRSDARGYLLLTAEGDSVLAELKAVESIKTRETGIRTLKRFRTMAGRPGVQPA